jgi:SMODS-associated and fused to various effectors sensor domain
MQTTSEILGWLANLIQIGTFVFTIWVLWRTRQRLQRLLQGVQSQTAGKPVALAIGIGGDIEGAVRQYLEQNQQTLPVRAYSRDGLVQKERFYLILRDLLRIKQELTEQGATEIHLFYKGPVTLALGVGAIFDNWLPIQTYDFGGGSYQPGFILHKGAVLGLLQESVSEGEEAVAAQVSG